AGMSAASSAFSLPRHIVPCGNNVVVETLCRCGSCGSSLHAVAKSGAAGHFCREFFGILIRRG
ncbi:hypothetical protein ACTUM3_15210, partial [Listeria monocytogenes]